MQFRVECSIDYRQIGKFHMSEVWICVVLLLYIFVVILIHLELLIWLVFSVNFSVADAEEVSTLVEASNCRKYANYKKI